MYQDFDLLCPQSLSLVFSKPKDAYLMEHSFVSHTAPNLLMISKHFLTSLKPPKTSVILDNCHHGDSRLDNLK